ncbi:MAG: anthranilate phosphoribosyltransferase [Elusimicrobia bacterium GWA2_69_24]|nr:MAG: anthranilate phosphoribosyltransferase [Elusimicrobia bacterium GWA2_69_24]HBL17352.1 anthranilate phosphoribosyltransferase [Elusimicrobiota bacterium]
MLLTGLAERATLGFHLTRAEAAAAMERLIDPAAGDAERRAFLLAMNSRPASAEELAGLAEALRARAVPFPAVSRPLVDTCGTGGDGLHTINISTGAAFVAAGAGAAVAKHGNRAVSSRAGSADVLEALGVPIGLEPAAAARSLEEAGFAFLFAPRYHPAMAAMAPARKALGVRTVFNLLGPLVNPARVRRQVVGIFDAGLLTIYAEALLALGSERALVVRGSDGMDELSVCGTTRIVHADPGNGVRETEITPESVGLQRRAVSELAGGDAAHNARTLEAALGGAPGAALDAVLFNAAGALLAAGLADSLQAGLDRARESVASGAAMASLDKARRAR